MEKVREIKSLLREDLKTDRIGRWLLISLLMNSRIVTSSPLAEELFIMFPDILQFQRRSLSEISFFQQLGEDDVVFVEDASVEELWTLGQHTSAQIVFISETELSNSLFEAQVTPAEFRSSTLELRKKYDRYKPHFHRQWLLGDLVVPALFLDRDGVVNVDHGYVTSEDKIDLYPGVLEFLQEAVQADFKIFAVTNQSGVSRGMMTRLQADKINYYLIKKLATEGIPVVEIQAAFYHEVGENLEGVFRASLRKPRSGMFSNLIEKYRLDPGQSLMVGDSARDLQAAAMAGVRHLYLLDSKKGSKELEAWNQWPLRSRALKASEFHFIQKLSEIQLRK